MKRRPLHTLARLFWRVLPRFLREPLAITAPMVLREYQMEGDREWWPTRSWLRHEERHEEHYYARPLFDGETITGWYVPGDAPEFDSETYPTEDAAFRALTAELAKRKDIVLVGGGR